MLAESNCVGQPGARLLPGTLHHSLLKDSERLSLLTDPQVVIYESVENVAFDTIHIFITCT